MNELNVGDAGARTVVKYSLKISDDYLVEGFARSRSLHGSRWFSCLLKGICALGLLAVMLIGIRAKVPLVAGIAVGFLVLLAYGHKFDYWVIRRHWRKHVAFNESVELVLADEKVTYRSPTSVTVSQWSRYGAAREFPDGVLCYSAPWDYYWLPDSGITEGTRDDVRALCRTKFAQYRVA